MDRDDAYREVSRLLAHYAELPYSELVRLADLPAIEVDASAPTGFVTFTVDIFHGSDDQVFINVMAHGNNWWRMNVIDETTCISKPE